MCLRVKLVRIAYHLLFPCLGQEVLRWPRQLLPHDVLACQSGSRVALAHPCMARQTLCPQHLRPYAAMQYVGLGAVAVYARRVAAHYADIVEHGCLLHESPVHAQFGMGITNAHSTLHDERAVRYQYMPELVVLRIVLVNQCINHRHRDAQCRLPRRPCPPCCPAWHQSLPACRRAQRERLQTRPKR